MSEQETAIMRQIGWVHPAYGRSCILGNEAKARLEERAPEDPTYVDGWLPVVVLENGRTEP